MRKEADSEQHGVCPSAVPRRIGANSEMSLPVAGVEGQSPQGVE